MIAEKASDSIDKAVAYELQNIVKNYGAVYASEHEGYAVLLEEVQEASEASKDMQDKLDIVWSSIRYNFSKEAIAVQLKEVAYKALALAEEAVQCAAVCERFLETVKK